MTFKLDENLGARTQQLFRAAGHGVQTVRDQGLDACSDEHLYEVCCAGQRCLVTLDLDFADITRFPPAHAKGIVVIRVSRNPSFALFEQLARQLLQAITQMSVEKKLWVVETGRIRIHQLEEDEEA